MEHPTLQFQGGRLGNRFFGNLALHFLAMKHNVPIHYTRESEFQQLGLTFFKTNTTRPLHNPIPLDMTDDNFVQIITQDLSGDHIFAMKDTFFQTKDFALFLANHFAKPEIQAPIRRANPLQDRYKNNNSVFVHVRLGDMTHACPTKDYYQTALKAIPFQDGFISSDTSYHPLVEDLAAEHSLQILRTRDATEIELLQLASTCRYLVLSQGTFSFMMGILGFDTELVQWPQIKKVWHGDIFVIPEWKEVAW